MSTLSILGVAFMVILGILIGLILFLDKGFED